MQPAKEVTQNGSGGSLEQLHKFLASGAIGFYSFFEATEIVAFVEGATTPINVFTIVVAEETAKQTTVDYRFLNATRIELTRLKGWKFGIVRYCRPIAELMFLTESVD